MAWRTQLRENADHSHSKEDKIQISDHAATFAGRLCRFLTAYLSASKEKRVTEYLQSMDFLQPFRKLALQNGIIKSMYGRKVVINLEYDTFLDNLNTFELKGQDPTAEFIKKDSFGAFLYHVPMDALAALGCAMKLAILAMEEQAQRPILIAGSTITAQDRERFLSNAQIDVRFLQLRPNVCMADVRTGVVGKLISVRGHVVKARHKALRVSTVDFSCNKCGNPVTHSFQEGQYSVPTSCGASGCKSRSFTIIRSSARYVTVQHIRLQEVQDESSAQAGRTPRQVEVELKNDLVDQTRAGDTVMVAAIVNAKNVALSQGKAGKKARETSTYKLYLQAHSITTLSDSVSQQLRKKTRVIYTDQQLRRIIQLCHADHMYFGMRERRAFPFDLLVRSVCPAIIGHDEVKAGLLLALLGGTPNNLQATEKGSAIRSNSHVLIIGDPGMGKSQMLLAASQLSSRSVYVGGNTSSTTGLTVTMTKEERGESSIEAGALVLADQGICCIDEFDKMAKNNQDGLLEAMEQQQVSIAKAGVVASLPARCSIVAAGNPKSSLKGENVAVDSISIAKPILSRFDLIFILRDKSDSELDKSVTESIFGLHKSKSAANSSTGTVNRGEAVREEANGENKGMGLLERIAWVSSFQKTPLPADLVRDYISYARENCHPKLTREAAAVLKDYYMNLR